MKILTIFLLFVAIGCYADDSSDITQKVIERKGNDGKVSVRTITTYRGQDKVMAETFRTNAQGALVLWSRSYLLSGKLVMMECEEHEPGKLDTICVYIPDTDAMEVFTRQADGSVKPVSTRLLSLYKEESATVSDLFRTLNNTNTTEAQWEQKVQEIKQKAKEIEKKMEDAEKPTTGGK
jgi:hypothetical protein